MKTHQYLIAEQELINYLQRHGEQHDAKVLIENICKRRTDIGEVHVRGAIWRLMDRGTVELTEQRTLRMST